MTPDRVRDQLASVLAAHQDGCTIAVLVRPRSRGNGIDGVVAGTLRIKLTAPPVEGAANAALVAFLAGVLNAPKRDIVLLRGDTGRRKLMLARRKSAPEILDQLAVRINAETGGG